MYGTVAIGCSLLFLLGGPLLDVIGWSYSNPDASAITKIHPSTYVFAAAAVLALLLGRRRYRKFVLRGEYLLFALATSILLVRAILIVRAGTTQGEMSAVLVTFLSSAMVLICFQGVTSVERTKLGRGVRIFFAINSAMAIAERIVGHRFIPSFIDNVGGNEQRATALLGHPLNAALLTGIMIVHLVSSRARSSLLIKVGEVLLHAAAMFAFGGRAALVLTPVVLWLSVLVSPLRQHARLTRLQKLLPLIILLIGICLVFLPLPFVDATIDRFANDDKSSMTRNSALLMLGTLNASQVLTGIDAAHRELLQAIFHSTAGIELAWVAFVMIYGLLATLPMAFALPLLLWRLARQLDQSAAYMALLFLVVTAGSLSIASKSLLLTQTLVMMLTLANRAPRRRPEQALAFENAWEDNPI